VRPARGHGGLCAVGLKRPRPSRLPGPAKVDQGVLELLDLACVKINKPKPRRLSLIMCRFQSTNVSVTGIHSSAPSRFSDVPGVAVASSSVR
jgi:hypothetical protein